MSIISFILIFLIVGNLLGSVTRQKDEYNKDLDNFIIKAPTQYRIVFLIGSAVFLAFTWLAYANRTPENGGLDASIIFLIFAIISVLSSIAMIKQITISEKSIKVRNFMPPQFKNFSFSEITHYCYSGDTIVVFSGNKKLFSADKDFLGYENLKNRLERDGFKVSDDGITEKVLTKKDVFLKNSSATALLVMFLIVGLIFGIVASRNVHIEAGETAVSNFIIGILVGIGMGVIVVVPFCYLPSFLNIRNLEKSLNINFNEEMRKEGITNYNARTRNWFLNMSGAVFTAIRRDMIAGIVSSKESDNHMFHIYKVQTKDGKIIKVRSDSGNDFESWLYWRY